MSLPAPGPLPSTVRRFRLRLFAAMAAVVVVLTAGGLYYAQRGAAASAERERLHDFRAVLEGLRTAREARAAELVRRCQALARKPRIHAALEDDALDLLYLSSRDELRDLMNPPANEVTGNWLRAEFYRFLDVHGNVITPVDVQDIGTLSEVETARLALPLIPATIQLGYLPRDRGEETFVEFITAPIFSSTTGKPIAALVVGFTPHARSGSDSAVMRGVCVGDRLSLPGLQQPEQLKKTLTAMKALGESDSSSVLELGGAPYFLLRQPLNPGSLYPTAHEICLYPLGPALHRQQLVRWEIVGVGALFLFGALGASHVVASRFSRPVEKLAVERSRAEAALELTQAELARSARFSSNASHELKTPVAVLRAGLDELLARDDLTPGAREEISALVQETTRFTTIIEDLLLLSRMDAGRLRIDFVPVDLNHLIDSCLDDVSVLPDPFGLSITTALPGKFCIAGEKRYVAHILQNLIENARRYNRPEGKIHITARSDGDRVFLSIGNTGKAIPAENQPHIFERFERGASGKNLPGHGLGLNLARDLARLHRGDVRLVRSAHDWTEFEVVFETASPLVTKEGAQT